MNRDKWKKHLKVWIIEASNRGYLVHKNSGLFTIYSARKEKL